MDTENRLRELRRWGVARFLYSEVMNLAMRLFGLHVHEILLRPAHGDRDLGWLPHGISVRVLEPNEVRKHAQDPALGMTADFVEAALERGDLCIVALEGEQPVAYAWRSFGRTPHLGSLDITFKPPIQYGYKALTQAGHRGKHLQAAIAHTADKALLERGLTHVISFVETHTFASKTATKREGGQHIGFAGYFSLRQERYVTFATRGCERYGFRFLRPDEPS
jgi:hypothetical protein